MPASIPCVRRNPATGGLGRQHRLERHLVEQESLDELRFGDGRGHLKQGFVGEEDPSLWDCPYLAGEAQPGEGLKRRIIESQFAQVLEVVVVKAVLLETLQGALHSRRNKEPSVGR